MPEASKAKKETSALARGGGSHGISNQPPPQPQSPPPAQAPLAPESFNPQPTPPRVDPMKLQPLGDRPRRPVEGYNSPMDGKAYVPPVRPDRPPKPIKPYDPATATPKEKIQHELEREWRLKHGVDNMGENFNPPPPKRDDDLSIGVPLNPFECDPRGRCAAPMPRDWVMPRPKKRPRLPKKKGKFQMGKKPRKPFKMGVPRKERIRLLKEQAAKEQWERDNPWTGGGENFPRPPPDWDPRPTNPRHNPLRPRERRPFGIL